MPSLPALRTRLTAVATLALVTALAAPTAAGAAPVPHHAAAHTPAATHHHAPFAVTRTVVPRASSVGFGGGTISTPRDTGRATLGAVVVTPGLSGTQADMAWYGTDLAAQGFIVFTIDTLDTGDLPSDRATEMLAAADYLTHSSAVKNRTSAGNVALLGYSLGGGGTLEAAQSRHDIRAAIALMPFDFPPTSDPNATTPAYPTLTTPTLVITGQKDTIATPADMGKPAYDSIPGSTPKQYLELAGAEHEAGQKTPNATIRVAVTAFLKRYLDGNSAYARFICPAPAATGAISASTSSCPTHR